MIRAKVSIGLIALLSAMAVAALVEPSPLAVRLRLDPSSTPLLPAGDAGVAGYRRAVVDFGDDEVYLVAMATDDVFTHDHLEALRSLGREITGIPEVRRVESLTNVTIIRNDAARDTLEVRALIGEIPDDQDGLVTLRHQALADPLLTKGLVGRDGSAAALNVRLQDGTDLERISTDVDGRIRGSIEAWSGADRRFYVAGRPHMKAAAHGIMLSDLLRLIPLAIAVMAGVLWVFTGTLRGVAIPLGTVLLATLWTFGLMAGCGVAVNLLTVVLGPVLIAVGGVYGVHVLAHYESVAAEATGAADAARRLHAAVRTPVLMAGATTAIGFGALTLTEAPAARELGGFAALGTLFVTALSLWGVPAFVALRPHRPAAGSARARAIAAGLEVALVRLAGWVARQWRVVIAAWALVCLLAAGLSARIEVDTDYLSFFPERSSLRRDFDAVDRLLTGAVPIYVVFSGDGPGTFARPESLRAVQRVQERFDALPGVSQTLSLVDQVRVVNQAVREGDPKEARIPDTEGELLEILHLIPKARKRPFANVDHSRVNLVVRTGEQGSEAIRSLVAALDDVLSEELSGPLRYEITGDTVLLNRSADALAWGQLRTVGVTAGAIFLIVALVFRSLRLAGVAMIPNLVPVLLFYGLLGAGLAPLSLPTSLIGSIVLGIAVDDTLHFLHRYRAGRHTGFTPAEAIIDCGRRVGRPIVITSVTLLLGFLVVAFSGFATLREFGLLVGATIAVCLATDLVLLPALLAGTRAR